MALSLLYAASGFGTLALETLWIREITLRVGSTLVAASLVLATFFLSAAVGNLFGAALASRFRRPLAGYGWFEMGAAVSAFVLFFLARPLWLQEGGMVLAAILVAVPSFLSGASFPLISEHLIRNPRERVARGGVLYGANLFGAAMGVLAGAVVLPWFFGMQGAFLFATGVLLTGGGLALWAAARWEPCRAVLRTAAASHPPQADALQQNTDKIPWKKFFTLLIFIFCGALSLAAQGLLISWAKQILQGSVYALAGVLAAFIFGLGTGSLLAAWLRHRGGSAAKTFAGFALSAALLLIFLPVVGRRLAEGLPPSLGSEPLGMLATTTCWSLLLLLPLTTCLGALFPLTWEIWVGAQHEGRALGQIIAANKLGAALGVWLGVFAILPAFGLPGGTCLMGTGYVLLAVLILLHQKVDRPRWLLTGAAGIAILGMIGTWIPHPAMGLLDNDKERATYPGPYGPVSVVDSTTANSRRIILNTQQRLNGTGNALSTQYHQAWIPLLFAHSVDHVVTIGMASGITSSAVLDFPIRRLDAIELVPEVVRAARDHFQPWNSRMFSDPRVRIRVGDGRQELRTLDTPPDVVICDLLFPQEDGAANLYSRDFFLEVRDGLKPGGLFCLWLPCYQLDDRTAGIILRTFADVFPQALVVRANFDPLQPVVGLIGSRESIPLGRAYLDEKLSGPVGRFLAERSPFFISPEHAWLAVVGDLRSARQGLGVYPATTDDRPLLAYLGPVQYAGRERLVGMSFAKWVAAHLEQPVWFSVDGGDTPISQMMDSSRASRAYYIAAVAESRIAGDTRSESTRLGQAVLWLGRAREAQPAVVLPPDALGR